MQEYLLPRSLCAMWGDEDPAASKRVVSSMRNIIENLFGHLVHTSHALWSKILKLKEYAVKGNEVGN